MEEQWEAVAEFPRYLVSNLGRVKRRAHDRTNKSGSVTKVFEKLMRSRPMPNNKCPSYVAIGIDLRKEGGDRKTVRVSRLVATAFVPNPDSLPVVNHIDSNPANNQADNLEWTTLKGNSQHCVKSGRAYTGNQKGTNNGRCKHSEDQIRQAKSLLAERKFSHQEIANATGMTKSAVAELSCGRRWKHIVT
jgi:hypothetical protein